MYLKSIKPYFTNDDDFNWNYGLACASTGDYKEAKERMMQAMKEQQVRDIRGLIVYIPSFVFSQTVAK